MKTKSILLIFGSFSFAWCLGLLVHESGHALAYAISNIKMTRFVVHPFGLSYIRSGEVALKNPAFIALMGPFLNIFLATLTFLSLKRKCSQALFPFLLWAGTAFLQESVGVYIGLFGGPLEDWGLMAKLGLPVFAGIAIGIILMGIGGLLSLAVMPISGVSPAYAFKRKITITFLGYWPIFVICFIYEALAKTGALFKREIALVSSLFLIVILTAIYKPENKILDRITGCRKDQVAWPAIGIALGLFLAMVVFELAVFN